MRMMTTVGIVSESSPTSRLEMYMATNDLTGDCQIANGTLIPPNLVMNKNTYASGGNFPRECKTLVTR